MRTKLFDSPLLSPLPVDQPRLPRSKRCFDLCAVALALPFVAIAAGCVALWIKLFSPGRVIFRQERVGYQGRRFQLYKFRTMRSDADCAAHRAHFEDLVTAQRPMHKLDATRDTRLIPGGKLLRASGADELPQLFNVLRGDMSVVGPRPCIPYEYEHYTAWHRLRLSSVPGLTGLWQVSGKNRTTFNEMVRLDIRYHKTRSLALDLLIAFKTLPVLWSQIVDASFLRRRRGVGKAQPPPLADQAANRDLSGNGEPLLPVQIRP